MTTGAEFLKRLELNWIPDPIVESVASDLHEIEDDSEDLFRAIALLRSQTENTRKSSETRVYKMRSRVITAIGRALNRDGGIDWHQVITNARQPREVIDIFLTLGLSEEQWENPYLLEIVLGREITIAIRGRFDNDQDWVSWTRQIDGMTSRSSTTLDSGRNREEEDSVRLTGLQGYTKPCEMEQYFRSIGLPSDFWKNDTWRDTLWVSQRERLGSVADQTLSAIQADNRFALGTFPRWMEEKKFTIFKKHEVQRIMKKGINWQDMINAPRRNVPLLARKAYSHVVKTWDMYPYHTMSDQDYDTFAPGVEPIQNPWPVLCACLDPEGRDSYRAKLARDEEVLMLASCLAESLWGHDGLTCCERIDWCNDPSDFELLFKVLNIPLERIGDREWMEKEAGEYTREYMGSSLQKSFADLVFAIDLRFGGYENFLAWMNGAPSLHTQVFQGVRACRRPGKFLVFCDEHGIPDGAWKSESWLLYTAQLPKGQGGVEKDLSVLVDAVENHPHMDEFGFGEISSYRQFVDNVDSSVTHQAHALEIVQRCAEDLGMSVDELLRPENKKKIEKYPQMEEAIKFLSTKNAERT